MSFERDEDGFIIEIETDEDTYDLEEILEDEDDWDEAFKPYEPSIVTNQIGYKPDSKKIATFRDVTNEQEFSVVNADTKQVVYTGKLYGEKFNSSANETNFFGDFSEVTGEGKYYITCGNLDESYPFEISENVYDTLLDDTVKMLYLQRCGTEVKDSVFSHPACHNTEAVVYGTNEKIDVSGGWHDAGDYGRYIVPALKLLQTYYMHMKQVQNFIMIISVFLKVETVQQIFLMKFVMNLNGC
jgi:endoglucanase